MFVHYPAGMEPDQEGYVHPAAGYRGFVDGIAVTAYNFGEFDCSSEVKKNTSSILTHKFEFPNLIYGMMTRYFVKHDYHSLISWENYVWLKINENSY